MSVVALRPAARRRVAPPLGTIRWRGIELGLLLLAALIALCGAALLSVVWERPLADPRFRPLYGYVVLLVVCHFALVAGRFRGDEVLLPIAATLTGIGLLLVTRLVPALAIRQFVWSTVGVHP